ncbi:MAG: hypothetical protein H8E21_07255 [Gammaproteobacteria bacterium]|nr:hypothetical protein [Gammaproteobacteria bacterium]
MSSYRRRPVSSPTVSHAIFYRATPLDAASSLHAGQFVAQTESAIQK